MTIPKRTPDAVFGPIPDHQISLDEILARDPELKMGPELVKRFAAEILTTLEDKGFVIHQKVDDVYRRPWGELIVRRESPQRLVKALKEGRDIELSFGGTFGDKFLNSATWHPQQKPETLRWAIQEGFSKAGGLFMVEAFDPNRRDITVEEIDNPVKTLRTPGGEIIDRTTYRATSGKIHPEDLKFILMGVVASRFPREMMTEEELERFEEHEIEMEEWEEGEKKGTRPDPMFILRAFTPQEKEGLEAA